MQVGAVLFAPMNIDTVTLDFKAKRLSVVRRVAISAKAPVRQLELGTWEKGTALELSDGGKAPIPELVQTHKKDKKDKKDQPASGKEAVNGQ